MTAREATVAPRQFYRDALSEAERSDLPSALEIEGVDEEIAMLRLRLRSALLDCPDDVQLMFKGVELLVKLVATRYRLSKDDSRELQEAFNEGLRDQMKLTFPRLDVHD